MTAWLYLACTCMHRHSELETTKKQSPTTRAVSCWMTQLLPTTTGPLPSSNSRDTRKPSRIVQRCSNWSPPTPRVSVTGLMYTYSTLPTFLLCPALLRRGTALVSLKEWKEAESAMETLLKLDPKNKRAQEMLSQARRELGQAKKKGRRVQIEEVDEEQEASDGSAAAPPTNPVPEVVPTLPQGPPPAEVTMVTVPMPEDVKQWKEKGNDLFRRGQYVDAVEVYSKAVNRLDKGGGGGGL